MGGWKKLREQIKARAKRVIKIVIFVLALSIGMIAGVINIASADAIGDLVANNTIGNIFQIVGQVFAGLATALNLGFVVPLGTWLIIAMIGMFFVIIAKVGKFGGGILDVFLDNMGTSFRDRYKK